MAPHPPVALRPLLITGDGYLLDELVRVAGTVGAVLDVAPDVPAARSRYPQAPLVLIGIDLAAACVRAGLPRRRAVVVVGRYVGDGPPDWGVADELCAEHIVALPLGEPWLAHRLAPVPATTGSVDVPTASLGLATGRTVERIRGARPWDRAAPEPDGARATPTLAGAPVVGVSRRRGLVVAVVGGRGGAGASVLATALAVTAARAGADTLLVDSDPLGGGLDLMLGWEDLDGARWPALAGAARPGAAPTLVNTLPRQESLSALSYDRSPTPQVPVDAIVTTLSAGRRARDLVVVDVPRRLDDGAALALAHADHGYLLVPAELRACAAAARVAEQVRAHCPQLSLVVRGPSPGGLTAQDVTAALGLPFAGYLRSEPGIPRDLESGVAPAGDGRGPLATLCRRLLEDLGLTPRGEAA